MLRELFGIELHGRPRVTAQHEHNDLGWGTSYIDLQIATDADLVLVENKTGIQLGVRVNPTSGEAVDQLEKYTKVLEASPVAEANRHLAMLVWAPQVGQGGRYFRGARYWWDLYEVIAATPSTGDRYADQLRDHLLVFFQKVQLDPIPAVTAAHLADVAMVHRLLARAISVAVQAGAALVHPRPGSGAAYLFELADTNGKPESWTFGFSAGELVARVSNGGYRRVELPLSFLSSEVDEQVAALAALLRGLPSAPPDPTRTGGLAEEDFLAGFAAMRPVVERLLARSADAGWSLRIGSWEAVLRPKEGSRFALYVSAVYRDGPQVRIWCASEALRDRVAAALKAEGLSASPQLNAESVRFVFTPRATPPSHLISVLELLVEWQPDP